MKSIHWGLVFISFFFLGFDAHAIEWDGSVTPFILPGNGLIQSQSNFILPDNSALMQGFWRGNQGFWRTVPIVNGEPDWNDTTRKWSSPLSIQILPGSGSIQSQSSFILPDGSALMQGIWRGNQGFWRTVPIINNQVCWDCANDWSSPMPIDILPGSGDMQAQMDLSYPSRNYVFQKICRGGSFYWRTVPIVNNSVDWNGASEWFGPLGTEGFPGSGKILSLDAYICSNGKEVQQAVWRGNYSNSQRGYYRNFDLDYPEQFALQENGTSSVDWIFDLPDYHIGSYVSPNTGSDHYANSWVFDYSPIERFNVRAMAPGIVIFTGVTQGWDYRKHVIVQCLDNPRFAYLYGRLKDYSVAIGDIVGTNTLIGQTGFLFNSLYKNITDSNSSFNNLKLGKSPSGVVNGTIEYAAPLDYLVPDEYPAVVVDDSDPDFHRTSGDWQERSSGFRNSCLVTWTTDYENGKLEGSWEPELPSPGNYEVKAFIPPVSSNIETRHASYRIIANDSTHSMQISQSVYPSANNHWFTLGIYYFNASGREYVILDNYSNYNSDRYSRTIFDAISFTKQ